MSKRKNNPVLLAYSDSEHDDDNLDDQSDESMSVHLNEPESNQSANQNNDNCVKNDSENVLYFEDVYGDRNLSILEFHQSLFGKNADEITIPPVTKLNCSTELQEQIENLFEKFKMGYDLNKAIQKRKSMRNPSIYDKMISYCQINEMATNYPKEIYNPEPFLKSEYYYENLSKLQKDEMEKREKERKENEKNNGATKKIASSSTVPFTGTEKKSKWDLTTTTTSTTNTSTSSTSAINQSAAIAALLANKVKNLTNQSNVTKPTVIAAFGTISKKK